VSSDKNHPGPPSFLEVLRFIWFFLWNGCETEWFIYAKTGGRALENAVITLISFDTLDIIRSCFRPKGLRTIPHRPGGRKNMSRVQGNPALPEPSDLICGRTLSETAAIEASYSFEGEIIWWIDTQIQKTLYYFMIANVIDQFAWDWYSGIIESPASNCALGRARIDSDAEVTNSGGWNTFVLDHVIFEHNNCFAFPTHFEFGPGKFFVSLMAKVAKPGPIFHDADCQIGLIDDYNAFHFAATSKRIRIDSTAPRSIIVSATVNGPGTITFMEYTMGDHLQFTELKAVIFQIDD
jgi:hypothetical protein